MDSLGSSLARRTAASALPPGFRPFVKALCKAARAMGASAVALANVEDTALEARVTWECLCYALHLVSLRLGTRRNGHRDFEFMRALRAACQSELRNARATGRGCLQLHSGPEASPTVCFDMLSRCSRQTPWNELEPGLFGEFCRATGLSSARLAGGGENVATLLFYIVLHGLVARDRPFTREQTTLLLRAAGQCRRQVQAACQVWLADPSRAREG